MFKTAKENLPALFRLIAENQELYLPVNTAGQVNFAAWTEDAEVAIDVLKTVKSPKDAFFRRAKIYINVQGTVRAFLSNQKLLRNRILLYSA